MLPISFYRTHFFLILIVFLVSFSVQASTNKNKKLPIQHGVTFKPVNDITKYWISEKLDGMRGYWNGKQLLTRKGHIIYSPKWFTQNWPNTAIDGELWMGRETFQQVVSCVRRKPNKHKNNIKKKVEINLKTKPSYDDCWHKVRFMMFDLPNHHGTFTTRVSTMKTLVQHSNSPYLEAVKQFKVADDSTLGKTLDNISIHKGEGLMLHLASAHYKKGRNSALMKLKKQQDSEAIVIAHIQGRGKYKHVLGALKVKTNEGVIFKIGSGFTDRERENPPAIGTIITFKYNGKTQAGIPRFARFWRIRTDRIP